MRGDEGQKTPKKANSPFIRRHMADFWDSLQSYLLQKLLTFIQVNESNIIVEIRSNIKCFMEIHRIYVELLLSNILKFNQF